MNLVPGHEPYHDEDCLESESSSGSDDLYTDNNDNTAIPILEESWDGDKALVINCSIMLLFDFITESEKNTNDRIKI